MQMDGKVVLITGANSGVGFAAALKLGELGATIVMLCRDADRGQAARRAITKVATGAAPALFLADLSSQAEIRAVADKIGEKFQRIDVLLNNAGAMFARRELTVDGIEKTLAVNHLAPFLLTNLLLPWVQAAPEGRIITVASESHSGSLEFDNLQGELHYNFFGSYNRSKLANVLFAHELARRLKDTRVTSNSVSPGPTRTPFGNDMKGLPSLFPLLIKRIPFLLHSPEKAAETYVYAASAPELANVTGRFFLPNREAKTKRSTYDTRVAARLWEISESLCAGSAATPRRVFELSDATNKLRHSAVRV
jgi:NAD(P)-dependent dehydrogenase (short-subunit alcohol dehydrogenase family)